MKGASLLRAIAALVVAAGALFAPRGACGDELRVGSKRFTESYILAEVVCAIAREEGEQASHSQGLGGTAIVARALEEGSIDVYPEYTGTIAEAIVKIPSSDVSALRAALAPRGLAMGGALGFQNTYALAVPRRVRGVTRISDLAARGDLRIGVSHEFLGRRDGWPGLAAHYGLDPGRASGVDHGLAYVAVERGSLDVVDVYSTDAEIARYELRTLEDDRGFFPRYDAVFLFRADAPNKFPKTFARLAGLGGRIDQHTMIALNARAEAGRASFREIGEAFVQQRPEAARGQRTLARGVLEAIVRHGPRHASLVAASVAAAIVAGVPLGIFAQRRRRVGAMLVSASGVVQTIPALALLCFFIPVLGIGRPPTLVALFLYSLLPIVRNTYTALEGIPPPLREAAEAIGLRARDRLLRVELPMASPTILAGIKTSAVVNVGTATIAAFIGAGGFGEPISTGLNLNDTFLVLQGAIPAALLAVLVEVGFSGVGRLVVPRGLRLGPRK